MKSLTLWKKVGLCLALIVIELLLFFTLKAWIVQEKQKKRPFVSTNEFLQTVDCAEIFDANLGKTFVITFEIRAKKEGKVLVYQQNGNTSKYTFREYVDVSEEYQTCSIIVTPVLANEKEDKSMLAFYGEYGSGVIPEVRNITIEVYVE